MTDGTEVLTRFGRILREERLLVGPDRIAAFCRAAALLPPDDLYWAGRATLVGRPQDLPVYDRAFAAFFGGEAGGASPPSTSGVLLAEVELAQASTVEVLRQKSFARCTPDELAALGALMERIPHVVPPRRTRRLQAARSGAPDLRRTLRRSFRTGGEPLERAWRRRRLRPRRLVLLVDVSGSMAEYSRALLVFAHAALRDQPRWEAFCFGTRLTRLTRALAATDLDEALRRAAEQVLDWDGGTRIGESLKRFLDDFGHAGLARGAVVVICSDGLEVGDPELLAQQMARLSRLAHRIVWLNPLMEDPAYEPLARGMQASLRYLDVFASGHNLASLEAVAGTLGAVGIASRHGPP